jgi:hypothetical protein
MEFGLDKYAKAVFKKRNSHKKLTLDITREIHYVGALKSSWPRP